MKKYTLLLILFIGCNVFAQEKMNAYKYAVVPSQFDFQKEPNQYGINQLLKYKFQQLGFETYLDTDELPFALKKNTCTYITPTIIPNNGMFITRVTVEVKNCLNQNLFTTEEGNSNDKSYKTSYTIALREALSSFRGYRLNYQPIPEEEVVVQKEYIKEDQPIVTSEKNANSKFLYNGTQFSLVKTNPLYHAEIKYTDLDKLIGTLSKTSKQGIYHVNLNTKRGLGYYDENGNFIMEFLEENGNVSLQKLQLLN